MYGSLFASGVDRRSPCDCSAGRQRLIFAVGLPGEEAVALRIRTAVFASCIAVLAPAPSVAHAAFPGKNGKIALESFAGGAGRALDDGPGRWKSVEPH